MNLHVKILQFAKTVDSRNSSVSDVLHSTSKGASHPSAAYVCRVMMFLWANMLTCTVLSMSNYLFGIPHDQLLFPTTDLVNSVYTPQRMYSGYNFVTPYPTTTEYACDILRQFVSDPEPIVCTCLILLCKEP